MLLFFLHNVVFLLNKGLINVYIIKDSKQINDITHGMIVINGITISMFVSLLSLVVQLHNVILLESVTFIIFIYKLLKGFYLYK